jgi:adenylate cyclase class IV
MIEVEKKFQPTKEQLDALLLDAQLVKEKTQHDTYYDFPDFRLFKKGIRLRKRGTGFELKIDPDRGISESQISIEIENDSEIMEYLGLSPVSGRGRKQDTSFGKKI